MPGNNRGHADGRAGRDGATRKSSVSSPPQASVQGDNTIIRHLNTILKNELTAINQYFLHSRMLADWGLSVLSKKVYDESIDEMKHADTLIQRILFLGGLPNLQDLGKLMIGENVSEVIDCDLKLELRAHPDLTAAIADSEKAKDYVSRELFVHILESEEEHIDWLQTQMRLIDQMGLQNFMQLQTKPNESGIS